MTALSTEAIVGASATYYIGSNAYHKIIVRVERKGQKIFATSARDILKASGLSLEEWNALNEIERALKTAEAHQEILNELIEIELSFDDKVSFEQATRWSENRLAKAFTKRRDGNYRGIGHDFGALIIGRQYEHRDPHV